MDFRELKNEFIFIPFHGCNSIGANLYLYHYEGKWIAVDCGIGFANKRKFPGVDIFVPDISILKKYKIKIEALIITHSHEDHIGGVSELYKELDCKIYCTTFAKEFLLEDMLSLKTKDKLNIVEIKLDENKKFKIGPFDIEMVRMTHSIVEATSLYIKTKAGSVFHTGDWKFDEMPVVGPLSDYQRLNEIGNESPDVLICDSTNILSNKENQHEGLLYDSILKIVKSSKQGVVITTFASNLNRIQTIANIAKKTGRKLIVSGSSLNRLIRIGRKSGYLLDLDFIEPKDAKGLKRNEMLIFSTGSQGEEMASTRKLAFDKHKYLRLSAGDKVIFSAKTIPGNEIEVFDIINKLIENNIEVVTEKDHFVHVSGHPYRSEILRLYTMLKPKCLIPMHGDKVMVQEHKNFAKDFGIESVMMSFNGIVVKIADGKINKIGKIDSHVVLIDGKRKISDDSNIIEERLNISKNGIIIIYFNFNTRDKKIVGKPNIKTFGIFDLKKDNNHLTEIKNILNKVGKNFIMKKQTTPEKIKNETKGLISKYISDKIGKSPVVSINISEI